MIPVTSPFIWWEVSAQMCLAWWMIPMELTHPQPSAELPPAQELEHEIFNVKWSAYPASNPTEVTPL